MAALPDIPLTWKVGLTLFGLLSLWGVIGGSYAFIYEKGRDAGRAEIRLSHSQAANTALEEAQKEMIDAFYELQAYEAELSTIPADQIRPSDPLIKRHYRMR